jgi:hypothetical protein
MRAPPPPPPPRARIHAKPYTARDGFAWPRAGRARTPGDILFWHRVETKFFDVGFTHWAIYVGACGRWDDARACWVMAREGDDALDGASSSSSSPRLVECVVHLWGAAEPTDADAGTSRDMDENASCVLTPLEDVGDDPRCGNAQFDAVYAPLRREDILDRCRLAVNAGFYEGRYGGYCVRANNCEHFATWARYGVRCSEQIESRVTVGLNIVRVAASLWKGAPMPGLDVAKAFILGPRSHPDDDADIRRAILDMRGGRARVYSAEDDVTHILDYMLDRVEMRAIAERAEAARWASRPPSERRVETEIASLSFGRERAPRARSPSSARHGRGDVVIDAEQFAHAAGALGAFVRSASSSAFRVLGAIGDELARPRGARASTDTASDDDDARDIRADDLPDAPAHA